MNKLNNEDIIILTEALDEWVRKGSMSGMVSGLMGSLLMDREKDPEGFAKMQAERKESQHKQEQTEMQRKRQATMLQAKLYEMQAELETKEIMDKIQS